MTSKRAEQAGVLVDPAALRRFVAGAYRSVGVPPTQAEVAADAMVRTDERGQQTHGVWFLPTYVEQIRDGRINAGAQPEIVRQTPATALIDGDDGLGSVVMVHACDVAAEKARAVGAATVVVRNSNHFGAAGYFTLRLAEMGFIAVAATNTYPAVAAPGSRAAVFGTDPISYCIPSSDGSPPIMLDIALSETAYTKIDQARARGEQIPLGWLLDASGAPTTDPTNLDSGTLLPMAAHKGYGLGILVETLSAVLSGAAFGRLAYENEMEGRRADIGHWLFVMDVAAFMPRDEFTDRLARLRNEVHAAPTMPGKTVMLPGEPEALREAETLATGLRLPPDTWNALRNQAEALDLRDVLEAALVSE